MQLDQLLHRTFGFSAFRANQEAVCRAATDGRDVLLVMPTGAGKSLCYQLPAIARGGTALVVSPLIALMDDQATKLTAAGLRVARIHSGLSRDDSRQACRDYLDGKLQFLFIAPERMRVPGFPEMLARRKPALIAIDEAHCISAWGHDFRPDYRLLGDYLPALRPAPIVALTATATPAVQADIVKQLRLDQPALFIHGFRRDNLHIEVVELSKPRRPEFIADFLAQPERRPAIVYAPSRKIAEELAAQLGRRFPASAYHAGLEPGVRERVQRHFLTGKLDVVVATIAFGMGIDKADVRTVMHAALPASVEAYYQEIGRAGRDGLPSRTVLLHSFADRKMHDFFLDRDYPPVTDLQRTAAALTEDFQMPDLLAQRLKMSRDILERSIEKLSGQGAVQTDMAGNVRRTPNSTATAAWQSGYAQQIAFRRSQIDRMQEFAETQQCRMTALIRHFGDTADGIRPCGRCDFCDPSTTQAHSFSEPSAAEDRHLRAILRTLDGSAPRATGRLFTDLALGPDRKTFDALLDGLARAGLLAMTQETFTNPEGKVIPYRKVSLTYDGQTLAPGAPLNVVLAGSTESAVYAVRARKGKGSRDRGTAQKSSTTLGSTEGKREDRKRREQQRTEIAASLTPDQKDLATRLKAWRLAEASINGRPAFWVLSDAVLYNVVLARPATLSQLQAVEGIGKGKVETYGAAVCALCRAESSPETASMAPSNSVFSADLSKSAPASTTQTEKRPVAASRAGTSFTKVSRPDPVSSPDRTSPPSPESFTADQQALELRLRDWRKSESERLGLPQFFILGTTALRSIVLLRPSTLSHLASIPGLGPDKLDRFGTSILQLCQP